MSTQFDFYNAVETVKNIGGVPPAEPASPTVSTIHIQSALALLSAAAFSASPTTQQPSPSQLKGAGGINLLSDPDEAPPSPLSMHSPSSSLHLDNHTPLSPVQQQCLPTDSTFAVGAPYLTNARSGGGPVRLQKRPAPGPIQYSKKGSYKCTWEACEREFKKPCLLKSHILTHTNEKPFGCSYEGCDMAFIRNHDLKRHERSVHGQGEGPGASCRFCAKAFTRKDSCLFHEATSCKYMPRPIS
ncbi:hypothetical protein BJ741DRAFT_595563 [Chytriomyces cf. hyalinus JEL632]|nr:hypothetical protein BJ741DRAFT_595563 [Chytriomyces cf. hyalinus JEL632]